MNLKNALVSHMLISLIEQYCKIHVTCNNHWSLNY